MKRFTTLILGVVVFLGVGAALAEFNHASYQPGSIKALMAEHPDDFFKATEEWKAARAKEAKDQATRDLILLATQTRTLNLGLNLLKHKFTVQYTGKSREIDPDVANLIREWIFAVKDGLTLPEGFADLFKKEILVSEDGKELWMPVQEMVHSYFEKELQPGDSMDIFVMWAGALDDQGVFLVNEFQARGKN